MNSQNISQTLILRGLENQISLCKNHLDSLMSILLTTDHFKQYFQLLQIALSDLITNIVTQFKENLNFDKQYKENIFLYLFQIITTLKFLVEVFKKEEATNMKFQVSRTFVKKRLLHCFDNLINPISTNTDIKDNFVTWMDIAVVKIAEFNINLDKSEVLIAFDELQTVFEQVLSHAMSIAHVSLDEDSKIIKGSCQTVLETLNSLMNEVKNDEQNKALCNLYTDACNDKLCALERHINIAVLNLCIEIFINYKASINSLYTYCNLGARTLCNLVLDTFDLQSEQFIQVGFFAVACSVNFKHRVNIRNFMASLESLQDEICSVLSVNENYQPNELYISLLRDFWLEQAALLKRFICIIIEPSVFIQVIYNKMKKIVEYLEERVKNKNWLKYNSVKPFIKLDHVFITFIKASSEEIGNKFENLKGMFKTIEVIHQEVDSATSALLLAKLGTKKSSERILLRCKVLLCYLKRFLRALKHDAENEDSSIIPCETVENKIQIPFFDHILNRGQQLAKERSILYKKTPKKKDERADVLLTLYKTSNFADGSSKLTTTRPVNLQNLTFAYKAHENKTFNLQVTEILEQLSNLSATFG